MCLANMKPLHLILYKNAGAVATVPVFYIKSEKTIYVRAGEPLQPQLSSLGCAKRGIKIADFDQGLARHPQTKPLPEIRSSRLRLSGKGLSLLFILFYNSNKIVRVLSYLISYFCVLGISDSNNTVNIFVFGKT